MEIKTVIPVFSSYTLTVSEPETMLSTNLRVRSFNLKIPLRASYKTGTNF